MRQYTRTSEHRYARLRAPGVCAALIVLFNALAVAVAESEHSILQCCSDFEEADRLWPCVEESIRKRSQDVLSSGSKVDMVVTTYMTKNLINYAAFSMAVLGWWAEIHGYPMRIYTEEDGRFDTYDERWNKVGVVKHAATEWAPQTKSVLWVDADLIVLKLSSTADTWLSEAPGALLMMCAEHRGSSTYTNSGTFFAVNTPQSIKLLDLWWTIEDRSLLSDQEAFDKVLLKHKNEIAVLPPSFFNTDPPAMTNMGSEDRVLHLMGETTRLRAAVFGHALKEICDAKKEGRDTKKQLGITKDYLLQTSYKIHKKEYEEALNEVRTSEPANITEALMYNLQKVSHPLQHALVHLGSEEQALNVEKTVYEEFGKSVRILRRQRRDVPPELVRRKIGQGLNYFSKITDPAIVPVLYSDIKADLDMLEMVVHPGQLATIIQMRSTLDQSIAMHYIEVEDWEAAIESTRDSIRILQHPDVLDHNQIKPMGTLASLLCQTEKYAEGLPMFEKLAKLQKKRFGPDHTALALTLLNSGICKYHANHFDEARKDLLAARRIYHTNEYPPHHTEVMRTVQFLEMATDEVDKEEL